MLRFGVSQATCVALGALLLVAGLTGNASAAWPERQVTYVIPFDPGGESDVTARFQEQYFTEVTGQKMVIQYKPGAGGATAWAQLNSYNPDGSTIMNVNFPHAVLQPAMQEVGYTTEDVKPTYVFHYTPDAIIVPADSPYQTLDDLIEDAKANPGAVTFGGSGTNSANHLATARFDKMTGTTTTYIPFDGSAPTMTALLGNQIKAAMSYTTQSIKAGDQVRTLAIATEARLDTFPDVPTFTELGYDYVAGAYRGVALPSETPEDIQAEVSKVIGEINEKPEFRQQMEENGYVLVDVPYDQVDAWLAEQEKEYAPGIEALKAK